MFGMPSVTRSHSFTCVRTDFCKKAEAILFLLFLGKSGFHFVKALAKHVVGGHYAHKGLCINLLDPITIQDPQEQK